MQLGATAPLDPPPDELRELDEAIGKQEAVLERHHRAGGLGEAHRLLDGRERQMPGSPLHRTRSHCHQQEREARGLEDEPEVVPHSAAGGVDVAHRARGPLPHRKPWDRLCQRRCERRDQ